MAIGDPTGSPLITGTTNGNTLTEAGTFEDREITLGAGTALTSGTVYAIVIGGAAAGQQAFWVCKSGNGYANGSSYLSSDAGSTWSIDTGYDNEFATKADETTKDSYDAADDSVYNTMDGNDWVAQTFTAGSSYTITSVVLRLARFTGSTPGTLTVGIYNTESDVTKATNPTPSDVATTVTLDQATLTWEDGGTSDSFDVYYGTESGNLTKVSSAQEGLSFTITGITDGSPFDYLVTRYWRVDSTVGVTTVTGDEWSFTTIRLSPPGPVYWYSTGGYYYQLLVQDDGTYGDPPPTGVEDTDYVVASFSANFIRTNRRLIALARNSLYYEDV